MDLLQTLRDFPQILEGDQSLYFEIVQEEVLHLLELAYKHAKNKQEMRSMLVHILHKVTQIKENNHE